MAITVPFGDWITGGSSPIPMRSQSPPKPEAMGGLEMGKTWENYGHVALPETNIEESKTGESSKIIKNRQT